jgi:hypothetical protein
MEEVDCRGFADFYQEFTPQIVGAWEDAAQKDEGAEWSCNCIKPLVPFLKKVMPRVGQNQSLFGLSIISLKEKVPNEENVVRYGLEPLLKAKIVSDEDVEKIVAWYKTTNPNWDSNNSKRFEKEFVIDEVNYKLITDSYRNCRDLNLQVIP